jgi:D-arabinose 1-dehydrogenase-like Zn-dependent alcohol dehydrogenase
MRAAVLREFGASPVATRLPRPNAGPGEALIRVRAVGLCGTDLKVTSGAMRPGPVLPTVLGHEIAGEVVTAPGGELPAGTRVACHPYVACGECRPCAAGRGNVCPNIRLFGFHRQGGLAEYLAIPVANLISFAANTGFGVAAVTMDAVATSWHALYGRGGMAAGERVVVVGAGGLGMNAVQIAVGAGAEVAVVDRNPQRRDTALACGAARAVSFDEVGTLREWSAGGADLAFEATGSLAGFTTAAEVLGVAGRLVCAGHHPSLDFALHSTGMVSRELTVLGSRGSTFTDAVAALAAVDRGDVRPQIDSVHSLDFVGEALAHLASGKARGRVVVEI